MSNKKAVSRRNMLLKECKDILIALIIKELLFPQGNFRIT